MTSTFITDDITHGLRSKVRGQVITPADPIFDGAKSAWNLATVHQPDLIVRATDQEDVAYAVKWAAENSIKISVQATGHGQPRGLSGGMLLDISALTSVVVDPVTQTARIGGGTKWREVIVAAEAHGLMPVSGSSSDVGAVGYTLGGGYGLLSRKFGLAVDSVLSMEVVIPSGDIVTASPTDNGDLFWALTGGGGSFGVVTSMTVRLYPQERLFGGQVMFDASLAESVYPAFVEWTKSLPNHVCPTIMMITFPPVPFVPEFLHGRTMVNVIAVVQADQAEAEALLQPMRGMTGAEVDTFQVMRFSDCDAVFREPEAPLPARARGVVLRDLDTHGAEQLVRAIGLPSHSPNMMIQMRLLGGAIASSGSDHVLGGRRGGQFLLHILGVPMAPGAADAMRDHAESVFQQMGCYMLARGPLNWLAEGEVDESLVRACFESHAHDRLSKTKSQIDPHNTFAYASVGL